MSVGLYKYDGDFYDRNSELVLSENIASERFYNKYWEKAINELNVKYIQDGAEIGNVTGMGNEKCWGKRFAIYER